MIKVTDGILVLLMAHIGLMTCTGVGDPSAKPVFTGMPGYWTVLMLYEPVRVYSNFINASVHSLCLGILLKNGKLFLVKGFGVLESGEGRGFSYIRYHLALFNLNILFIVIIICVYMHVSACVYVLGTCVLECMCVLGMCVLVYMCSMVLCTGACVYIRHLCACL